MLTQNPSSCSESLSVTGSGLLFVPGLKLGTFPWLPPPDSLASLTSSGCRTDQIFLDPPPQEGT